jgi:hypothetical protein
MKKIFIIGGILISSSILFAGTIKPASLNEVSRVLKSLQNEIKTNHENMVNVYTSAIEIEKRATTPWIANTIAQEIIKASKINQKEFINLRENYSFADISIAYAINQLTSKPIGKILRLKNNFGWRDVFSQYNCSYNRASSIIKKLDLPEFKK